jgi:hypothetical protein
MRVRAGSSTMTMSRLQVALGASAQRQRTQGFGATGRSANRAAGDFFPQLSKPLSSYLMHILEFAVGLCSRLSLRLGQP